MTEELEKDITKDKCFYKNMNIYVLHRSIEKDHEKGRPAILLKYKSVTSLVWWGTHKSERNSDEKPLILKLNKTPTYFYSKGVEKVDNEDLKDRWINYETNNIYELNDIEQKELITTFVQFTNQNDPYERINLLEIENQILKQKKQELQQQLESEYELE